MTKSALFIISFGELDISPIIYYTLILITVFVFLAVLISTAKLIQSLVNDQD